MFQNTHAPLSTMLRKLMAQEEGFIISTELVLISTITVLGLVAALTCVRDAVVGEMKDVANAVGSLNQSYHYTGMHGCITPKCGLTSFTTGSQFVDRRDNEEAIQIEGGNHTIQPVPTAPKAEVPQVEVRQVDVLPAIPCPGRNIAPPPACCPTAIQGQGAELHSVPHHAPCDCGVQHSTIPVEVLSPSTPTPCGGCNISDQPNVGFHGGVAPNSTTDWSYGPQSVYSGYRGSLAPRVAQPMFLQVAPGTNVVW